MSLSRRECVTAAALLPSALVPASPWLDAAVPPPLVDEQPGLVASSLSRTGVESERASMRLMDHD